MEQFVKTRSLVVVLTLWLLVACGQVATTPTLTATLPPTPLPTNTPAPTDTPTPSPTSTPGPLSASQIFDLVSPSVAYVETETASGSGILIAGGYIVTNAHVIYPYRIARIVFPDRSEYLDTPVVGWDLEADLAVLGPVDTSVPTLELVDGEGRLIGGDAYLLGYPGETNQFPTPTITRGLISRVREWEAAGITFFQSDAAIAGGQSGGVLLSDRGEVVGVSSYRFTEAGYAIVASAADVTERIRQIVTGANGFPPDQLLDADEQTAGKLEQSAILDIGEKRLFIMNLEAGQRVELGLSVIDGMAFSLVEPDGYELMNSDSPSAVVAHYTGPHFLILENTGSSNGVVRIISNRVMTAYEDVENGELALRGTTQAGKLNYAGANDYFYIPLKAGDFIRVKAESVMIDPFLTVGYEGAGQEAVAMDDDTGKGVFGMDAELAYFASHTGLYWVSVEDSYGKDVGGYLLTVEKWDGAGPTPFVPPTTPTPTVNDLGRFTAYVSRSGRFSLQVSAEWEAYQEPEVCPSNIDCFVDPAQESILMLLEAQDSLVTPEQFAASMSGLLTSADAEQPIGESRATESGATIEVFVFGSALGKYYMFAYSIGRDLFAAIYIVDPEAVMRLEPIIDYTFSTFTDVGN